MLIGKKGRGEKGIFRKKEKKGEKKRHRPPSLKAFINLRNRFKEYLSFLGNR